MLPASTSEGARGHTGFVEKMPLNPEGINKEEKGGGMKMFSKQSLVPCSSSASQGMCFHCEPVGIAAHVTASSSATQELDTAIFLSDGFSSMGRPHTSELLSSF